MASRALPCPHGRAPRTTGRAVAARASGRCKTGAARLSVSEAVVNISSRVSVASHMRSLVRVQAERHDRSIPDDRQLNIWRNCQAVCFDVDCALPAADSCLRTCERCTSISSDTSELSLYRRAKPRGLLRVFCRSAYVCCGLLYRLQPLGVAAAWPCCIFYCFFKNPRLQFITIIIRHPTTNSLMQAPF
jgi:hypothetical protein